MYYSLLRNAENSLPKSLKHPTIFSAIYTVLLSVIMKLINGHLNLFNVLIKKKEDKRICQRKKNYAIKKALTLKRC